MLFRSILQPLDVGCFSPLKQRYGRVILGLARNGILHVDKMTYLPAFREAFNASITEQNIRGSFQGAGLVPFNPEAVLSNLTVPIRTPTPPTTNNPAWEPKTPSNTVEFGSQSKLISTKLGSSPSSLKDGINQLVKGAHKMAHQVELMRDRIASLEKTVEEATKRKSRKRKRIQQGGTLTYKAGSELAPAEDNTVEYSTQRSSSKVRAGTVQPARRRCGTCGGTGHNARTCQIVEDSTVDSSSSDGSTVNDSTVK